MGIRHGVEKENRITQPIVPITMRRADVCEFLKISSSTLTRWMNEGKLPDQISICGIKMWRRDEIEAWFKAGSPSCAEWNKIRDEWLK